MVSSLKCCATPILHRTLQCNHLRSLFSVALFHPWEDRKDVPPRPKPVAQTCTDSCVEAEFDKPPGGFPRFLQQCQGTSVTASVCFLKKVHSTCSSTSKCGLRARAGPPPSVLKISPHNAHVQRPANIARTFFACTASLRPTKRRPGARCGELNAKARRTCRGAGSSEAKLTEKAYRASVVVTLPTFLWREALGQLKSLGGRDLTR